jgi:hypothetical protein
MKHPAGLKKTLTKIGRTLSRDIRNNPCVLSFA